MVRIASETVAVDGTRKFLIELDDKKLVESVLIFHKRTVCACISSQVGCPVKCSFCATGMMGFSRNLSADEIFAQFSLMNEKLKAENLQPITNVVFMGMGEPLLNLDAVVGSIKLLQSTSLSWHKITVSTVGIPEKIVALGKSVKCRIAWSLHAPSDVLRSELVPVNKSFRISDVVSALNNFPSSKHDPVMIEYVMLKGVNDSIENAMELVSVLKLLPFVIVNLIPFNSSGASFSRPDSNVILAFKKTLIDSGIKTIIRTTKGADANAACGMLIVNKSPVQ